MNNSPFGIVTILLFWFLPSILVGFAGLNRRGGFWRAFLISIFLSPFIGILLTVFGGQRNPKGCNHCDNKYNEVEYCGICGKNEKGFLKDI
ncbi:MAG: hypothetical protein COA58_00695 [Bacteroidetes bacterium]|nr:MAG: hypothetical protein COA58_00695 [Bacteroidota bacterium]